jgi:hypothetical protein
VLIRGVWIAKIKGVDKIMLPRQGRIISTASFIDPLARPKGVHHPASMPCQKDLHRREVHARTLLRSTPVGVAVVSTMCAYCQGPGRQFAAEEFGLWELWDT